MQDFISAFLLIFLAEMGDKTQLLALAFSTKYKARTVLLGVAAGAFLNHGLAILLGSLIGKLIPMNLIQLLASSLFIYFGLTSFLLEFEDEEEESTSNKFGPFFTVASAFFIGELGDKTQLTAMTLGVKSSLPIIVLAATTIGMVCVSSLGIIVGKLLGKKIPEVTMKFIAGLVFISFGSIGLYDILPVFSKSTTSTSLYMTLYALLMGISLFIIYRINSRNKTTYYEASLINLLSTCRQCQKHDISCHIGLEIEATQKAYLGQTIPYLGNIIQNLESLKKIDLTKGSSLEEKCKALNIDISKKKET